MRKIYSFLLIVTSATGVGTNIGGLGGSERQLC